MRPYLAFLALLAAIVVLPHPATAQQGQAIDSVEAALIRKIIKSTNMGDQMLLSMEAAVPVQREANPAIPAVFWDRFLARARSRKEELLDQMIPIYAAVFSTRELEQLVQFWQSDIGQRFVGAQPQLIAEIGQVAEAWGGKLGVEIAQELEAEGVTIGPPRSPPQPTTPGGKPQP